MSGIYDYSEFDVNGLPVFSDDEDAEFFQDHTIATKHVDLSHEILLLEEQQIELQGRIDDLEAQLSEIVKHKVAMWQIRASIQSLGITGLVQP